MRIDRSAHQFDGSTRLAKLAAMHLRHAAGPVASFILALFAGCGAPPAEEDVFRVQSAFSVAAPLELRFTTLRTGATGGLQPTVTVSAGLPGGGGSATIGRYTPDGIVNPNTDFDCAGAPVCTLDLTTSGVADFHGTLPANTASSPGSVGFTLTPCPTLGPGSVCGSVVPFSLDATGTVSPSGSGPPVSQCIPSPVGSVGGANDTWQACWEVSVGACAPGQTDWWCCNNTGTTTLDFNVVPGSDDPAAGDCRPTSVAGAGSSCSLQGVFQVAKLATPNGCQVTGHLAAATYAPATTLPLVNGALTLRGAGMTNTTILAPSSGAFTLPPDESPSNCVHPPVILARDSGLVLQDLTVQSSSTAQVEGVCFISRGLSGSSSLTLQRSRVTGFNARAIVGRVLESGKGILLQMDHALIDHNHGPGNDGLRGGGVYLAGTESDGGAAADISHSTIANNTSDGDGGGIAFVGQGNRNVYETTISDNVAQLNGGGIYSGDRPYLQVDFVTIAFNTAGGAGGGIYKAPTPATVIIDSSLVANNKAGSGPNPDLDVQANLSLPAQSAGDGGVSCYSSQVFLNGSAWTATTRPPDLSTAPDHCDFATQSALLGPLADTDDGSNKLPMRFPKSGSPALDAVTNPLRKDQTDDQRGSARPVAPNAFPVSCSPRCDRGAIEINPTTDVLMDFESATQWTSSAPHSASATRKTRGQFGLAVGGAGYRVVNSVPFPTPLSRLGATAELDVFVPGGQPNPYWLGAVQLYTSCPSSGIYNAYLGQGELTGKPVNAFSTLSFSVPGNVRTALGNHASDCFFSVAVNMNQTPTAPVLDNLRLIQ